MLLCVRAVCVCQGTWVLVWEQILVEWVCALRFLPFKGLGSNALWHLHGVFTTAQQ